MDTSSQNPGPPPARFDARKYRLALLLAGVALPLAILTSRGIEQDRVAQPVATAPQSSAMPLAQVGPLADALAGIHLGLSDADRAAYRLAFAAADRDDWQAVDTIVTRIADRRLVGHLLAARHLAPDADPAYADLRGWLDLYADLPESGEIYRLAEARQPADAPGLTDPRSITGDPPAAGPSERDSAGSDAAQRAFRRFTASDDKGALDEAVHAIGTLGAKSPETHWVAGLAAWRLGQLEEAGRHFASVAISREASGWMQAAGAYWAGRVDERRGIQSAGKWFSTASRFPTTFYGMLAIRKLGRDVARQISAASLTAEHLDFLAETPAGYRAVALLQIGRTELAARELERIDPAGNPKIEEAIILAADAGGMAKLSPELAQRIARPADDTDDAFPIPAWKPQGGFRVDPALVFAVARQESGFDPRAVSPAGASGLMQLMPGTAHILSPNRQSSLFDPSTNLELGQRYLRNLMRDPNIGENLLLLAVAYNRGAGNPSQFRKMLGSGDPLLAVESIGKSETHDFIQRVLANYWIYQARMGGDTTSLTDLANGRWPVYRWQSNRDALALTYRLIDE